MTELRETLGIDLGGTNIRAARISNNGTVLARISHKVPRGRAAQLQIIRECVQQLLTPEILGIGLGFPGRVRISDGHLLSAGYLELDDVPLGNLLRAATGLPVIVDNDAYMATYAEMHVGAAVSRQNVVTFTIGTGIGGAIAIGGELFYGSGIAGHVGHLTIKANGPICNCGRKGCIETLSSGTALNRLIADHDLPVETRIEDLLMMQAEGKQIAQSILREWISPLKCAIDSMVAALGPDIVLLGGGLGQSAAETLSRFPDLTSSSWFDCPVVPCSLGDSAGVIGAGLRVFQQIDR